MSKSKEIIVKQNEEKPVPVEVLAASIVAISEGIKKLRSGPLNDKALVLLIQHAAPNIGGRYQMTPLSVKAIRAVLEGMESLESEYLKPKQKAKP